MSPKSRGLSALLLLQLMAFWPVGHWYWLRLADGKESQWGVAALLAGIFFTLKERPVPALQLHLCIPTIMMIVYSVSHDFFPPICRAGLAIMALTMTISGNNSRRICFPLLGLFLLALPVIPTLQFYLGYPMRLASGSLAVVLLRGCGFQVNLQGVTLDWGGSLILIDGPCSGVKMLWVALFLTSILAICHNLTTLKSIWAYVTCVLLVTLANGLRAASLFLIEAGLFPAPGWFHDGVGLVVFAMTAGILTWGISYLSGFSGKKNRKVTTSKTTFNWRPQCEP